MANFYDDQAPARSGRLQLDHPPGVPVRPRGTQVRGLRGQGLPHAAHVRPVAQVRPLDRRATRARQHRQCTREQRHALQVRTTINIGVTRRRNEGVVEILCDQSP
jgi:hypothetical protein